MQIALTATKNLLESNYFDICAVDRICNVIGAEASGPAYDLLRALHCVHYSKMPTEVRQSIPGLLREIFSIPQITEEQVKSIFKGVRA